MVLMIILRGQNWMRRQNQRVWLEKRRKNYEVDSTTSYRYYRLSVEANNGSATTQIAEWKLVAIRSTIEYQQRLLVKVPSTFSAITPMGRQHENDREATADQT